MFCPDALEALIKQQSTQIFDFSDKKSERAKDMHLLKRLTMLLKNREVDPGKMIKLLIFCINGIDQNITGTSSTRLTCYFCAA